MRRMPILLLFFHSTYCATMKITEWSHLLVFHWAGLTITAIPILLVLYNRWTNIKNGKMKLKASKLNILASMLKRLNRDLQEDRLMIEYQFEILFGARFSAEEIKALVKLPSPLNAIRLPIKSAETIRYEPPNFVLTTKSSLETITKIWTIIYSLSAVLLTASYIAIIATHNLSWLCGLGLSILGILFWVIHATKFYSAKFFLKLEPHKARVQHNGVPKHHTK